MGLYTVTELNLTKFNLIYSSLHPREVNRNLENNQTTLHQPESRKVLLRSNGLSISVYYKPTDSHNYLLYIRPLNHNT